MKPILLLIVCLLLLSSGCKDNPSGPSLSNEIWPLKPGNVWLYFAEYLDMGVIDTLVVEVTGTMSVTIDGGTHHAVKYAYYSVSQERPNVEWLARQGSGGVYTLGGVSNTDTLLLKALWLKYPAAVGDTWPVPTIAFSLYYQRFYVRDTLTYTLVATDEILETPAGKFKCHVYQYSKRPEDDIAVIWDYKYYFSPGIGLVGYFAVSPTAEIFLKEKFTLWKYSIKR